MDEMRVGRRPRCEVRSSNEGDHPVKQPSRLYRLFAPFVLAAAIASGIAADFWVSKPFQTWDEKECKRVLTKSPWAFSNAFGTVANIGVIEVGAAGERETNVIFRFRFLSAKPVRMALVRLQALGRPGGTPAAQMQQVVDSPADPQDRIALQLEFEVEPPSSMESREIHSFLLNATIADFRNDTRLDSSAGVSLSPVEYLAPTRQRTNPALIFPRLNDKGQPAFSGDEKWISFKTKILTYRIFQRLKPKEMMFGGHLEL